jgi:enamine deaminase RidA (YjgF/YER057c/UK114 family)
MTERTAVNPWAWSLAFGFNQGELVAGAERVLFCAGQTSVDENGAPQHAGDMAGQAALAIDNLEAVLRAAGMSLAGVAPAGALLGVARLAFPELLLEIEATAVA